MPSTPDLTELSDTPLAPSDVLAHVKAEGLRRRNRRHRRNAVLAALGLALVAVPVVTLLPGDDGGEQELQVAATADQSSTTLDESPTTSPSTTGTTLVAPTTVVVPVTEAPTDEPGPTTTAPPRAPRTTVPQADPQPSVPPTTIPPPPPNQPLTAGFVDAPTQVVAGTEVTFTVQWSDPDAQLSHQYFSTDGVALGPACTVEPGAPPATPNPGSGTLTFPHTFAEPGTYRVAVALGTGNCAAPYADSTSLAVDVVVEAAPAA